MSHSESHIESRIAYFAQQAEKAASFDDWKLATEKMLEWKYLRLPSTVRRLEAGRLAQVQASAKASSLKNNGVIL